MIVTDIKGGTLRLDKSGLYELTGETSKSFLWFTTLEELRKVGHSDLQRIALGRYAPDNRQIPLSEGRCYINAYWCQIGCRRFDETTFKQILAYARRYGKRGK